MAGDTQENGTGGVVDAFKKTPKIITLDIIFRAALGYVFVGMIIAAEGMPKTTFGDPSAYPRFVGVIGLVLWIASNLTELRNALKGHQQGRIYDIAFQTTGMKASVVWLRTAWVFGIMGATIVGVWLVNFHVAIPTFLVAYLVFVGKLNWRLSLVIAFLVELPIAFLYGSLIHTAWPLSVVERVFGFQFQTPIDNFYYDVVLKNFGL